MPVQLFGASFATNEPVIATSASSAKNVLITMNVGKGNIDRAATLTRMTSHRFPGITIRAAALLVAGVALWVGCSSNSDGPLPPTPSPTIYVRLGGQAGVDRITGALYSRLRTDPLIGSRFAATDSAMFTRSLASFICKNTGGSCNYLGKSLPEAHAGMHITTEESNAFLTDLLNGMEDAGVSDSVQQVMLQVFAPMNSDVVNQ
jgi:hemoglobin